MALKYTIKKAAYDALPDALKSEYIAGEKDGEYVLDVSDLPQGEDPAPLKRSLEREREAHKATKAALGEANDKIAAVPDVEALKTAHKTETQKLTTFVEKTLKDSVATGLAAKISTVPDLLAPKIAERLVVDMSGDEPKTVILGKDGKPDAAMTIDKLREEVVANPAYKGIIIGSKATGGGAPVGTTRPLGGGAPKDGNEQSPDLSKLDGKSLAARLTEAREAQQAQS
jgi:hypothetical protein